MTESKQQPGRLIVDSLVVINVGIELFYQSLDAQGVETISVNWKPTPEISTEMNDILSQLL